jgi:hypothetical protein
MFCENGNIILHQIIDDGKIYIRETKPILYDSSSTKILSLNKYKKLEWIPFEIKGSNQIYISNNDGIISIDASVDSRVIMDDKIRETNIYYLDGRMGLGRAPLYTYNFDIAVPENTLMTAVHIGDGKFGFSMGNGTNQGFIPEIIGMGADENDAGLYFIGRAGNNISSSIPLIILDGRNSYNKALTNRPILGVTNSNYAEYKFLIDHKGLVGIGKIPSINRLEVKGKIQAEDFILDSSISFNQLINIIKNQKIEIDLMKAKITNLEKLINVSKIS